MNNGSARPIAVLLVTLFWILSGWLCPVEAQAGMIVTDPSLPPADGKYRGEPLSQPASYGPFEATEIWMVDFQNIIRSTDGADELLTFDIKLTALLTKAFDTPLSPPVPIAFTGPLTARVFGKAGQTTGTWDAEIVSADTSGSLGPITGMLRENPSFPSTGSIIITDLGGGQYHVDSFFDIHTELSGDGGSTWIPDANGPHHMILVPEPATLVLVGLGGLALIRRRRC